MLSNLVENAAKRTPDQIALRDPDQTLSYSELADQCARLATFLQLHGVAPGDRVAIAMPVSVTSWLAVHGVFRSGGAFVPVDPEAPTERMRAILDDCGVENIIADPSVRERLLQAIGERPVLLIGTGGNDPREVSWDQIQNNLPAPTDVPPDPTRLAYVMYTSGSTGTPKGIAHSHASGFAYAERSVDTYELTQQDTIAVTGPLHFDISTMATLAAPLAGATTALVTTACARMPASLAAWLAESKVTVLYTVASGLVNLVDRGSLDKLDLAVLRWILFCGEPLPPAQLARAMDAFPGVWFSNSYGPAEVNQCTFYHIAPDSDPTAFQDQIPIGHCWSDTDSLLLDDAKPVDETGELAIASPTMMKGYWNRPDLEARAYFTAPDGKKFYRTGDLARRCDDGFVLVGRMDRQVKLRGYRVELDEIELNLAAHPDVAEAAVYPILKGQTLIDIAAAVIFKKGQDPTNLRKFLAERLPRYALPGRLETVASLPRTTSGKIDRRALAEAARVFSDEKDQQ